MAGSHWRRAVAIWLLRNSTLHVMQKLPEVFRVGGPIAGGVHGCVYGVEGIGFGPEGVGYSGISSNT